MSKYSAASALLFLIGIASAQSPAVRPEFEVASIRPNTSGVDRMTWDGPPHRARFTATNVDLKTLIRLAYKLKDSEISGGPGWIGSDRFDIAASLPGSKPTADQSRSMLQTLLANRFKLEVHRETREIPVYALLPVRNAPKLPEAREGTCVEFAPDGTPPPQSRLAPCGGFVSGPNLLAGGRISMTQFVDALGNIMDRPIIDKTGYTGTFNVRLEFAAQSTRPPADAASDRPSIFTAIKEQLGLKLESQKGPVEVLVIDRVERTPTGN
jgi:uncharacterized protein (TIGR03435 family)